MKWLNWIKRTLTNSRNPAQWWSDWLSGGTSSSSGVAVSNESSLTYTPFWAAVRIISGAIGALPLKTYRRTSDGKELAPNETPSSLLDGMANQYMTSMKLQETVTAHALNWGNGYAEIERDGGGRPIALWPLPPGQTIRKLTDEGTPFYEVRIGGQAFQILYLDVIHIAGLGMDGYTGYNVAAKHKEAIGLGMAVKQFGAEFFANGASPTGTLEHPGGLSVEAQKRLRSDFEKNYKGLDKSHRIMILWEGMKWEQIGTDPEKAQALETQKFSVDDVSRIFNIPPHKLASMDRATFSNIEEQNLDFLTQTLLYWFRTWETECNNKLVLPAKQGKVFVEFKIEAFLRGNIKARYEAYNTGRNGGWLNVNEIRAFENMNSIGEKGDIYLEPLNMQPAGTGPQTEPEPPATEEDERNLYIETWRGLLTKESKAMQRFAKNPETFTAKAEEFYSSHTSHIFMVIEPVLRAKLGAAASNLAAARLSDEYTRNAVLRIRTEADWDAAEHAFPIAMANRMLGVNDNDRQTNN